MKRLVAAVVLAFVAAPPVAAQTVRRTDIAEADAIRRDVAARLESVTARYEEDIHRAEELQIELSTLAAQVAATQRELDEAKVEARRVVRELYMSSGTSHVGSLFDAASFTEIPVRASYLELATRADVAALQRLTALEESYDDQVARLADAAAEQERIVGETEQLAQEILTELRAAETEYRAVVAEFERQEEERRRREEEERRRLEAEAAAAAAAAAAATSTTTTTTSTTVAVGDTTTTTTTEAPADTTSTTVAETTTTTVAVTTTTAAPTPGMVCPIDGATTFVDSWGDPRSGGRSHQGVDMIADRGTPTVAIESGTVTRMSNGGLGGITVWFRGASGDEYYYAHLDGWAAGLGVGDALSVGELLGYVGNTGNARYTLPHLHFEHHPGAGSAINPYPLVKSLCG